MGVGVASQEVPLVKRTYNGRHNEFTWQTIGKREKEKSEAEIALDKQTNTITDLVVKTNLRRFGGFDCTIITMLLKSYTTHASIGSMRPLERTVTTTTLCIKNKTREICNSMVIAEVHIDFMFLH